MGEYTEEMLNYMRKTLWKETVLTLTGATQELLGPSNNRIALILNTHTTNDVFYSFTEAGMAGGLVLKPNAGPLVLSIFDVGNIVTSRVFIQGTAGDNIVVQEILKT